MLHLLIITLLISTTVEGRLKSKRETSIQLCDAAYNSTNRVNCFCTKLSKEQDSIRSADCYLLIEGVEENDDDWNDFAQINTTNKIIFTTTRNINFKYIPTRAIAHLKMATRIGVKYAQIKEIKAHAFANSSAVVELTLSDNHIQTLHKHSFANHENLITINLDKNDVTEINRQVFVNLPALENLFINSNNISTVHDKAFVHLHKLKELDLSRNSIISLNTETFSGLKNLERLYLNFNLLEVIGDNTFTHLSKLLALNLENNKIQMLDEKAFHGLAKLQHLSLAMNKLESLDGSKLFEHLESLKSLSIRGNKLKVIRADVMAPILGNFYGESNKFDFDDNDFPCDCRLEWFISLKNKTINEYLQQTIDNLKCIPDQDLSDTYNRIVEAEKSNGNSFDDEQNQAQDDEYYDSSQLNGELFYSDIRDIINCTNTTYKTSTTTSKPALEKGNYKDVTTPPVFVSNVVTTIKPKIVETKAEIKTENSITTQRSFSTSRRTKIENHGVLDLSVYESRTEGEDHANIEDLTTTKLATVSAKPEQKVYEDDKMASDEAIPDSKAHTSSRNSEKLHAGNANNNVFSLVLLLLTLALLRL